jgi:protein SCO1/2
MKTIIPPALLPSDNVTRTPEVCHTLYDKFLGGVAGLLLTGLVALGAAETPSDCCKVDSAPNVAVCCAAMPAAAFSKDSLFQTDATFTDDAGRPFTLGSLRGRPVVLTMFFASCGYACPLLVTDLQAIRGRLPADQRDRAVFVLVSFDSARDTPAALAKYRTQRGLDGAWVLLHGGDEAVRELAALLGVKYKQESDGMYSHSNLITLLNGEGEIVHQRTGLKGGLDEAAAILGRLAAFKP